jgi:uncharacterized membrane protein
MNRFTQFAVDFTLYATGLMCIIVGLFITILVIVYNEGRKRDKMHKKISEKLEETNKIFRSLNNHLK